MTKEEAEKIVDHIRAIMPENSDFVFVFRPPGSPAMECFLYTTSCPACYLEDVYDAMAEKGLTECQSSTTHMNNTQPDLIQAISEASELTKRLNSTIKES